MKKKNIYIFQLLLLFSFFTGIFISCEEPVEGLPVVTNIRVVEKDSSITAGEFGLTIAIQGNNLSSVRKLLFNNKETYLNPSYVTNSNIICQIPSDAPTEVTNLITLITESGQNVVANFNVVLPLPQIFMASNEYALPGSTVTVFGNYFYVIEKVLVGETEVEVTAKNDTQISFIMPEASKAPITVIGAGGTSVSLFNLHDNETGMICNFDNVNTYSWGATAVQNDPMAYPGNDGNYVTMEFTNVGSGDGSWWNAGRSINLNATQLIPADELTNPIENYVMKFEIYVKEPWSNGTLMINPQGAWNYIKLYKPWMIDANTSRAFSTEGWQTVAIPLNEFLTKKDGNDGTGDAAKKITDLLGDTGNGSMQFMLNNTSSVAIDKFAIAIDNIRIIRVK